LVREADLPSHRAPAFGATPVPKTQTGRSDRFR
jgi:hypothetical protein